MSQDDDKAAWLIMQLAEQGRLEEVAAQMIASAHTDGSVTPYIEAFDCLANIQKRVYELLVDYHNGDPGIWEGLLPGPGGEQPHHRVIWGDSWITVRLMGKLTSDKGWVVKRESTYEYGTWKEIVFQPTPNAQNRDSIEPGDVIQIPEVYFQRLS